MAQQHIKRWSDHLPWRGVVCGGWNPPRHPPAPSLWEGECACGDAAGRGVMVSGVRGRADIAGSFPRVGGMIQEGKRRREEETERRSGRGCAAWAWGAREFVGWAVQRRGCAHKDGVVLERRDDGLFGGLGRNWAWEAALRDGSEYTSEDDQSRRAAVL